MPPNADLCVRICAVLEFLTTSCEPPDTLEAAAEAHSQLYRWVHVAMDPTCSHPSWLAEFEALEAELRGEGRLRG